MKRIGIVLAVLGAAAACRRPPEARHLPETSRRLATAVVQRTSGPGRIEIDGVVVGRYEAVLSSRLSAPVVSVPAVPGDSVRAGTVLVRLEERESQGALAGARAGARAAETAADLATRNRARFERLESRGAAAVLELDRARQDEAAAVAALASSRATLRRAETDAGQTVLTAPFDAVVVERLVSPGDLAAPGRPLVKLASVSGRRVEASPAEEDAAALSPGSELEVIVGGRTITSRVAEIVGTVDPSTRRRLVRVDLPPDVQPPLGSFARVLLPGPAAVKLLAPARAIVERGGLELAWAVGADGSIRLRYVRTGVRRGDDVEVLSGLAAGERVVLDPPADLTAGTRVSS
jgi:RND family efflux transporter MFP subunit